MRIPSPRSLTARGGAALALTVCVGAALIAPPSATASVAPPAHEHAGPRPDPRLLEHCTGENPVVCTFPDLAPGHYDVSVLLGADDAAASTQVEAESRRLLSAAVSTAAGTRERRTFTVNVRDPQGQQNQPVGTGEPGLTLTFSGDAPRVAAIGIAEASPRTVRLALVGDSTVTDQDLLPWAGWGQRLPAYFRGGVSVVNHSGSGESSTSTLAKTVLFDSLEPQLRGGDVVLIQLAHNDKTTTAEQYRANLNEMIDRIRARGATAVLVTPIVRLRFDGDQINPIGLIVTEQADLPAEMRAVAAERGAPLIDLTARSEAIVEGLGPIDSEPIYLVREVGDRTHTSVHGASVYAGVIAEELRALDLLPQRVWSETPPVG